MQWGKREAVLRIGSSYAAYGIRKFLVCIQFGIITHYRLMPSLNP
jgi:hypothetical protein